MVLRHGNRRCRIEQPNDRLHVSIPQSIYLSASLGPPMFSVAAVIATHDRPELLARRSLAWVARQTRLPDYLVVVDDSDTEFRPVN